MRVLVIYCHPVAESFAAAAHVVVLEALRQAGHEVTDVDLYAEAFDPVMSRQERLDYQNPERNERLVKHYDDQLAVTEALVLIYPAWWYGMPAMLKGYFDRVWLPGVAFDVTPGGNVSTECQSALNIDPRSASKIDPSARRLVPVVHRGDPRVAECPQRG